MTDPTTMRLGRIKRWARDALYYHEHGYPALARHAMAQIKRESEHLEGRDDDDAQGVGRMGVGQAVDALA